LARSRASRREEFADNGRLTACLANGPAHNAPVPRLILVLLTLGLGLTGCTGPHYNADDQLVDAPETTPAPRSYQAPTSTAKTPATPPRQPVAPPWILVTDWTRSNNLPSPRPVSVGERPIFEIESAQGTFVFQAGTRNARYNGMMLQLGFAPWLFAGQPCLHALDLQCNVSPLLLSTPQWLEHQRIIVLDPGHGGSNTGTRSAAGALEKKYTLDWARRLAPLLEKDGWTVYLTRTNDTELTLSNRVEFATELGADLFLSLHFNASGAGTHQSGLETYCLTPTGMPSNLTRGYEDDLTSIYPNNAFDGENLQLATRIHKGLLQINGADDRGIRRARFMGVLRRQECPAILIEAGFLSNPEEAARIAQPAYRQQLATAVAEALRIERTAR
jgi:N-acetylmuramoyl-L-alanine amidase